MCTCIHLLILMWRSYGTEFRILTWITLFGRCGFARCRKRWVWAQGSKEFRPAAAPWASWPRWIMRSMAQGLLCLGPAAGIRHRWRWSPQRRKSLHWPKLSRTWTGTKADRIWLCTATKQPSLLTRACLWNRGCRWWRKLRVCQSPTKRPWIQFVLWCWRRTKSWRTGSASSPCYTNLPCLKAALAAQSSKAWLCGFAQMAVWNWIQTMWYLFTREPVFFLLAALWSRATSARTFCHAVPWMVLPQTCQKPKTCHAGAGKWSQSFVSPQHWDTTLKSCFKRFSVLGPYQKKLYGFRAGEVWPRLKSGTQTGIMLELESSMIEIAANLFSSPRRSIVCFLQVPSRISYIIRHTYWNESVIDLWDGLILFTVKYNVLKSETFIQPFEFPSFVFFHIFLGMFG